MALTRDTRSRYAKKGWIRRRRGAEEKLNPEHATFQFNDQDVQEHEYEVREAPGRHRFVLVWVTRDGKAVRAYTSSSHKAALPDGEWVKGGDHGYLYAQDPSKVLSALRAAGYKNVSFKHHRFGE